MKNSLKTTTIIYHKEMSSSVASVSSSTVSPSSERFIGRVKWFNNKAGYGFVTVTDGPKSGSDVFVHHSSVKVDSEQYKYLVQGEYVEFSLSDTKTSGHEFQAGDVSGIKGGKLMCETRRDLKVSRTQYKATNSQSEAVAEDVVPTLEAKTPRAISSSEEEPVWTQVPKARAKKPIEDATPRRPVASSGRGRGRPPRGGRGEGK
jgi:cold shock CspA family protein